MMAHRRARESGAAWVLAPIAVVVACSVLVCWYFKPTLLLGVLMALAGMLGLGLLRLDLRGLERLFFASMPLFFSIRLDVHLVPGVKHQFSVYIVDVLWLALMGCWALRVRFSRQPVVIPRAISCCALLMVALFLVAGLRSNLVFNGVRTGLGFLQGYLLLLYFWNLRPCRRDCLWLGFGLCGALFLQAAIGGLQGATGSTLGLELFGSSSASYQVDSLGLSRVGGTIGSPNKFAIFVTSLVFAPLAMMLVVRAWWLRVALGLGLVAGMTALVLTRSRASWLSAGMMFMVMAYLYLRTRMGRFHACFTLGWIGIVALAVALAIPATRERLLMDDQGSSYGRINQAMTASAMIADNPFGVGSGNYVSNMHLYDQSGDGQSLRFRHPVHNTFLLIAAEQGILCVVVVLALLYLCLRQMPPVLRLGGGLFPRFLAIAIWSGICANLIHWMFEGHTISLHNWLMLGAANSMSRVLLDDAAAAPPVVAAG